MFLWRRERQPIDWNLQDSQFEWSYRRLMKITNLLLKFLFCLLQIKNEDEFYCDHSCQVAMVSLYLV